MKKKFLSILCCFSVLLAGTQLQEVYASENLNAEQLDLEMIDVMDIADIGKNAMDNALIQAYTNKIQNMTASEFDKMIAEMVETTENKSILKEKLALCGVELSIDKNVPISPMSLDDREVNFSNYTAKRGGENYYRLYTTMTFDSQELHPGSLDALITFFDPNLAKFKDYNIVTEDAFTINSHRSSSKGYVSFNFHDELICGLGYKDSYTVVLYVVPTSKGKEISYGAELGHSYTKTNIQVSGSLSYTLPNVFGGQITFTPVKSELCWNTGSAPQGFVPN